MTAAARPPSRVLMTADAVGGVWTFALDLARALAGRGVGTTLAVMGPPVRRDQRAAAAAVPGLTLEEGPFRLEWMPGAEADLPGAGDWLLDLERRLRPDVIHVNGYAAAALPFRAPVLCVAHSCVLSWWRAVHGADAPAAWAAYAERVTVALRLADLVAAPTAAMLAALSRHYGTPARALVINNGCDALRFRPLPRRRPYIVGVGRLWDEGKNLAALDAVAPRVDWPILLAGEATAPGGERRRPRHARHLGRLSAEAVAACLGEAAIFAHPARYEPFGLAPLEAAMAGCALVLGDLESLRELWDGAALFVDPDDRSGLTRALMRLIDDPARRTGLARAARRRAGRYTLDRMARGYLDAYARLAHARAERPSLLSGVSCASSSSFIPSSPAGITATRTSFAASSGS